MREVSEMRLRVSAEAIGAPMNPRRMGLGPHTIVFNIGRELGV